MKTRPLMLIGTVLALASLSLPFIISETSPKPEIRQMPNLELMGELVNLGCTEPAINHASRYSNLLDDSFDGNYAINAIGLPYNLSQEEFDECVKIILEKQNPVESENEHYEIEIIGMNDVYFVGEQYDFSYIISGYGYSCGSKEITFPDQYGDIMKIASSSSCIAGVPMESFVLDSKKQYDTTSVHGVIKIPGIYNVTVTFDRPSQDNPTTVSKEFEVHDTDDLAQVVFGNAIKSWTKFPGGVGPVAPENFTLTKIYRDSGFGMPTLDFEAMLNDQIFVDKCESKGGVWNYTYQDCEGIWEICENVGGIAIQKNITPPCTGVCLDRNVYRMSCVFEYEN